MRFAIAGIASAVLLAACGGGGGSAEPGPAQPAAESFEVSGVAAKGLLAGGIVTAHAVRADGSIDPQALATASAPTDDAGRYTLRVPGAASRPYVIKVTVPEGGATHRDEASGNRQTLPAGFAMRALVVPAAASLTANLTPFSEMAAEAAEDAGITADSARQANHTIKSMLGISAAGELTAVPVRSTADATGADEQRLAAMLTAVSQMAFSGAAGCSGDDGARTRCVVETLSNATTSPSSYALSGDAAAALANALQTVLATPSLVGNVPPSVLAPAVAALECEGVACNAPAPAPALDAAGGIAATKAMLTELRSDIAALFGSSDGLEPGALSVEKNKFGAAMSGVQVPTDLLSKDTPALVAGVTLFNEYKAGVRPANQPWGGSGSASCHVAQDTQGTPATAPANARFVECMVFHAYAYASDYSSSSYYDHRIVLAPAAAAGDWTYTARARETKYSGSFSTAPTVSVIGSAATGTLTIAFDAAGVLATFNVEGKLPAAFRSSGQVASDSSEWTMRGTRTLNAAGSAVSALTTLSGTIVAKSSAGATLSTLQLKSGSVSEIPSSRSADGSAVAPGSAFAVQAGGSEIAAASFDVLWSVPGAEFEGVLSATDSAWDKSGVRHIPTRATLEGRLANIASGVATDFIQGKLSVVVGGFGQYDALAATSESNFFSVNATLGAHVTAPGRPLLAVSFGTSWKSFEAQPKTATLELRSFGGGTPRAAISVNANVDAQGLATLTLAETIKGVSVSARQGATSGDVMLNGGTKIGVLDADTGILNFTDGSFVSAF